MKTGLGKLFAWDMKKMVLSATEAEEDENEDLSSWIKWLAGSHPTSVRDSAGYQGQDSAGL